MSKQNNNLPETEDYGNDIVTLVDENGKETEFEIVDSLVTDNNEYFALIPTETADNLSEDDGELVILKVVEENGEEFLAAYLKDMGMEGAIPALEKIQDGLFIKKNLDLFCHQGQTERILCVFADLYTGCMDLPFGIFLPWPQIFF